MTETNNNENQSSILTRLEHSMSVQSIQEDLKEVFRSNSALVSVLLFLITKILFNVCVATQLIDIVSVHGYLGILFVFLGVLVFCCYHICYSFLYRNFCKVTVVFIACYFLINLFLYKLLKNYLNVTHDPDNTCFLISSILFINIIWLLCFIFRIIWSYKSIKSIFNKIVLKEFFSSFFEPDYNLSKLPPDKFRIRFDEFNKFITFSNTFVSVSFTFIIVICITLSFFEEFDFITYALINNFVN